MIPQEIRCKLWEFNHGNMRGFEGPIASEIISLLFPDKKRTLIELRQGSDVISNAPRYSLRTALQRLKRRGLVAYGNDYRYFLTDLGRWFAISHKLGLSFLELCILACACCVQERYAKSGNKGFYMASSFEKIFKEYYSKQYLKDILASLGKKGYASRYAKGSLSVFEGVREELMSSYGIYLEGLEGWLCSLKEHELEIFSRALEGFER